GDPRPAARAQRHAGLGRAVAAPAGRRGLPRAARPRPHPRRRGLAAHRRRGHPHPDRSPGALGEQEAGRLMAGNLRRFYLFRLLATSYLWVPVFYHFMTSRGLGFDEIMLLAAIYSGVVILVEIPTGALADRIGRRTSMMAGALAMVVSCLIAYSAHSFAVFVVAEVFAAVSMSLCSGADSAYLFDLLHANGRGDE